MQRATSLGGPHVLLPTRHVERWIRELGNAPRPANGLYGIVCDVTGLLGVVNPWEQPILVFGDEPTDIFFAPDIHDGLFFRWVGADSLASLQEFAISQSQKVEWEETLQWIVYDSDMTLMDSCIPSLEHAETIRLQLRTGTYTMRSRYASNGATMTILHRLDYLG